MSGVIEVKDVHMHIGVRGVIRVLCTRRGKVPVVKLRVASTIVVRVRVMSHALEPVHNEGMTNIVCERGTHLCTVPSCALAGVQDH